MLPFSVRNIAEQIKIAASLSEAQLQQTDFHPHGFELFSLPITKPKMDARLRDLDTLDLIVSHVTAVTGGFGVATSRVVAWRDLIRGQHVPLPIMAQLADAMAGTGQVVKLANGDLVFVGDDEQVMMLARRLALWERYRGTVPYHQIAATNGDNISNRELLHRTWHAGLGNYGAGFAVDVGGQEALRGWHIDTGRAALRTLCDRILAVSEKARRDGIRIAPHRAFSKNRRGDTGANVHREIVIPAVAELDCLRIDYTLVRGSGRPVPRTWDPAALFDANGRIIA